MAAYSAAGEPNASPVRDASLPTTSSPTSANAIVRPRALRTSRRRMAAIRKGTSSGAVSPWDSGVHTRCGIDSCSQIRTSSSRVHGTGTPRCR